MKAETKQVVEVVGILGIIASLIFVGVQLRQDRRIAEAEIYAARAESRMANLRNLLASEAALDSLTAETHSFPAWWKGPTSEENEIAFRLVEATRIRNEINFAAWDNIFYQIEPGLMEQEADEFYRSVIEQAFKKWPSTMALGKSETENFAPERIRVIMQEIAQKIESE